MITTHTLGQVYNPASLSKADALVHTDLLTLHTGSVSEQVAFNHHLFGFDQACSGSTKCTEWFGSSQYFEAITPKQDIALKLNTDALVEQIKQADKAGYTCKASVLGPISLLWSLNLSDDAERMSYLDKVMPLYTQLLTEMGEHKLPWIQFDEPMLTQELSREWQHAYRTSYFRLQRAPVKVMVASTYGALNRNLQIACQLPVQAIHIDACTAPEQILRVVDWLPRHKILSLGVLSADDLAKTDLNKWLEKLTPFANRLKERLWLAPNMSLQHLPVESPKDGANTEQNAFVLQKVRELITLAQGLKQGEFKQPVRLPRTNAPVDIQKPAQTQVA
ncbi:hypothetical protein [Leucothrix pacifica]|uniref:Cobalamin-independent methionine synthase MetE N-terminal domain-containing protein n=1 Tax=Leucothrix pacifica TaxID=1247513 RepID=A0A317CUX6_9GAMM|nr:hypothetical protein [Leucothrix pacifica]PWR00291.1 hypothetical protein DKW60_01690 [Leucothrix pacifica]